MRIAVTAPSQDRTGLGMAVMLASLDQARPFSCDYAQRGREQRSGTVAQFAHAFRLGTMNATKDRAAFFHAVTDDVGAAVRASRRDAMDRAFETVERVGHPVHDHLKRLVIVVSASFASGHGPPHMLFRQRHGIQSGAGAPVPMFEHPPTRPNVLQRCPVWTARNRCCSERKPPCRARSTT